MPEGQQGFAFEMIVLQGSALHCTGLKGTDFIEKNVKIIVLNKSCAHNVHTGVQKMIKLFNMQAQCQMYSSFFFI